MIWASMFHVAQHCFTFCASFPFKPYCFRRQISNKNANTYDLRCTILFTHSELWNRLVCKSVRLPESEHFLTESHTFAFIHMPNHITLQLLGFYLERNECRRKQHILQMNKAGKNFTFKLCDSFHFMITL